MKESWKLMSRLKLDGQTKDGPIHVIVYASVYTDDEKGCLGVSLA